MSVEFADPLPKVKHVFDKCWCGKPIIGGQKCPTCGNRYLTGARRMVGGPRDGDEFPGPLNGDFTYCNYLLCSTTPGMPVYRFEWLVELWIWCEWMREIPGWPSM